jgi:hypothetical protein
MAPAKATAVLLPKKTRIAPFTSRPSHGQQYQPTKNCRDAYTAASDRLGALLVKPRGQRLVDHIAGFDAAAGGGLMGQSTSQRLRSDR